MAVPLVTNDEPFQYLPVVLSRMVIVTLATPEMESEAVP